MDEHLLIRKVNQTLRTLPDIDLCSTAVRRSNRDSGIDFEIQMSVLGRPVLLLAAVKQSGYPRDMRAVAWRLAALRKESEHILTLPMIVAPMLSENSRAFLREQNLAYCDAGGSVYLKLPWALIIIDRPRSDAEKRITKKLFRGASAQVLHLLLTEPEHKWQVQEVANRAELAPSTAHQVLSTLEREAIVESTGKGPNLVRRLCDPGALLSSWAEAHSLTVYNHRTYYRWTQTPAKLREIVTSEMNLRELPYALTLTSGAELSAPYATTVDQLTILLPGDADLEEIAEAATLKPVAVGGNITYMITKDKSPLMFRRRIDDISVASDIQLYLDLYSLPARGREQAEHLRRERLAF